MHSVLRSGGGHSHLHMRTHVSVSRVWTQAKETDQRLLPDLPETHQGRDQNLQAMRRCRTLKAAENQLELSVISGPFCSFDSCSITSLCVPTLNSTPQKKTPLPLPDPDAVEQHEVCLMLAQTF